MTEHRARVGSLDSEESGCWRTTGRIRGDNFRKRNENVCHDMSKAECVGKFTGLANRYPMDVEQDGMAPRVMQLNVANLYDYVIGAGIHVKN